MADKSGSENPGAKPVPSGAKPPTEIDPSGPGKILVWPEGVVDVRVQLESAGGDEVRVLGIPPEQATLLARAVLEAQGWQFAADGTLAVLPSKAIEADPDETVAIAALEARGWLVPPIPKGRILLHPAGENPHRFLEGYAVGTLVAAGAVNMPGVDGKAFEFFSDLPVPAGCVSLNMSEGGDLYMAVSARCADGRVRSETFTLLGPGKDVRTVEYPTNVRPSPKSEPS